MARDPQEYEAMAELVRGGLDVDALRSLLAELRREQAPEVPATAPPPDSSAAAVAALARKHAVIGPLEVPPTLPAAVGSAASVLLQQPITRTALASLDSALAAALEQVRLDRIQLDRDEKEARRLTVHADLLDAYMQLLNDLIKRRKTDG